MRLCLGIFSAAAILIATAASAQPAPAQGELARTVRVLVHNIYGRREADCQERYKALAAHILAAEPPFDVVALNEHWKVPIDRWFTCDADVLTRAIESDGRYAGAGRSVQHLPSGGPLEVSGGDSIFTRYRITATSQGKFAGRKFPLSGFALARVELGPGAALDVWGVHLEAGSDGCDRGCRRRQLADFAAAVKRGKSKNPVLLVGDFNIGGPLSASEKPPYSGNAGYEDIMDAFKSPRDLWLESGDGAEGFTYDCATNPLGKCGYRERIDYVFLPGDPAFQSASSEFILAPRAVSVVRWKTPAGIFVSDHYGLDATLELRRRPGASGPSGPPLAASLRRWLDASGSRTPDWDRADRR